MTHLGAGLSARANLVVGEPIGIFAENTKEWLIVEQACNAYGFVLVPLLDLGSEFLISVINDSKMRVLVSSRIDTLRLCESLQALKCPHLESIIQIEPIQYEEDAMLRQLGIQLVPFDFVEKDGAKYPKEFEKIEPSTLACIYYTIRGNGETKRIHLSNENILTSAKNLLSAQGMKLTCEDVHFSHFPLGNILERTVTTAVIQVGGSIGFLGRDRNLLVKDIKAVRPTLLYGNSPFLAKYYRNFKIVNRSKRLPARFIFSLAVLAKKRLMEKLKHAAGLTAFQSFQMRCWNYLFFQNYRNLLGGRVRRLLVCGPTLPRSQYEFLELCFCIPVIQLYQKSEFGVAAAGPPDQLLPLACNQIRLVNVTKWSRLPGIGEAIAGEICVRGPNIPAAKTLPPWRYDEEGWFHTQEVGAFSQTGTLKIFGPFSDILEPMHGLYVFSSYLENVYIETAIVKQIWVTCFTYRPLVAILHPDKELLFMWAHKHNLNQSMAELCQRPEIVDSVLAALTNVASSAGLNEYEYLEAIHLSPEPFTVQNGLMTPTRDLRRPNLAKKFEPDLRRLYRSLGIQLQEEKRIATESPSDWAQFANPELASLRGNLVGDFLLTSSLEAVLPPPTEQREEKEEDNPRDVGC